MRIAFVTESLLPLVDGVSLTLAHLFDSLLAAGIEFRVYSPFVPPPEIPWSGHVRKLPSVAFPLYSDYRVTLPWGSGLSRDLDEWQPDLVHVVSPTFVAGSAKRWASRNGVPVVASFHTQFVAYFRYYGVRPLESLGWMLLRRFYRDCAAVYAPSQAIVDELAGRGIRPVRVWSRGVDAHAFSPDWRDPELRARVGASEDVPLLLMVSRLVREKDLRDLVPMARRLEAEGVSFRLALVGDGPLREELEAELPNAVFAGHQTGAQLSRWYASADVFVFPSTTETFGNVVQESLASGVPAVVVDTGGPQTVIDPGVSGLVARANDPADLARQAARLLTNPALRESMGRAARDQTERRSWPRVNQVLVECYRELTDGIEDREPSAENVA